jgi:hypothetical protein
MIFAILPATELVFLKIDSDTRCIGIEGVPDELS